MKLATTSHDHHPLHSDHPDESTKTDGITVQGLTKSYGKHRVLQGLDLRLESGKVYGLLGANGVGKTTLMSVILNHTFRSSGQVRIDGQNPAENARVLERTCFIHEDQRWHDEYTARHLLQALPAFYPRWSAQTAQHLLDRFSVPRKTPLKKLSRGQRSALAISISLASRADYTFLDEPYLGLDPSSRNIFYEELMLAVSEHPRLVLMSTHLIDEAANLMEDVILMRWGRIDLHAPVEDVTASMTAVRGMDTAVDEFTAGYDVVSSQSLGRIKSVLVRGSVVGREQQRAEDLHLSVESPGLQEIVAALGVLDAEQNTPEHVENKGDLS
ncbi:MULTISPECIES: ABC transporter ATP-binding protein [Kocuria]|uniref:ABC transporter ATP-binding protein n=1 Tax=Kocuria subflava TaxID=1736139 RepID=A0A846UB70_9MICC|nr:MULTISPECIES: ABC transporter ATP-binding protein [Kocuria]NKE10756.1 ABC transporter ATP-binding protein [Kocuria subflava]